jgi:hypothetical protein
MDGDCNVGPRAAHRPELNRSRPSPLIMEQQKSIPFVMEGQMDSETLQIVVFVVVAIIAIAAGVYVIRPEKKSLRTPEA